MIDHKSELKKIDKELKAVRKGNKRKYYFSRLLDEPFDYLKQEHAYVMQRIQEEKQQCFEFLCNPENAKGVWDTKKPNHQKEKEWADKAYPTYNVDAFELEFAKEYCISQLRNS